MTDKVLFDFLKIFKKLELNEKPVIKGSVALKLAGKIDREVNDIDFSYSGQVTTSYLQEQWEEFVSNFKVIGSDEDNEMLKIIYIDLDGQKLRLEMMFADNIVRDHTKKVDGILITDPLKCLFGKINSLAYYLSKFYEKDDTRGLLTVSDIEKNCDFILSTEDLEAKMEDYIGDAIDVDSIIHSFYYQEHLDLFFLKENILQLIEKKYLIKLSSKFQKVLLMFRQIYLNNEAINSKLKWANEYISCNKDILKFFEKGYEIQSVSGFEDNFANFLIKNANSKMEYERLNNNIFWGGKISKVLFLSHIDEVGGVIIENKLLAIGNLDWTDGKKLLFSPNGQKSQYDFGEISKASRKNKQLNPLSTITTNTYDGYIVLPRTEFSLFGNEVLTRNHDNKTTALLLDYMFGKNLIANSSLLFTAQEEKLLGGIKQVKESKLVDFSSFDLIINFEATKVEKWRNAGLAFRLFDDFSIYDKNAYGPLVELCQKLRIPFYFYGGTGSSDATEVLPVNSKVVTVSLPVSNIHGEDSKLLLNNLYYLFIFLKAVDNEKFL